MIQLPKLHHNGRAHSSSEPQYKPHQSNPHFMGNWGEKRALYYIAVIPVRVLISSQIGFMPIHYFVIKGIFIAKDGVKHYIWENWTGRSNLHAVTLRKVC